MTVIIQLITKLNSLNDLCEKLKTAEKAEAIEIKAEAEALYKSCYADYRTTQDTINNIGNGDKQLAELHVLVAETAFRTENYPISRKVVEKYLQFEPQLDHFYCRAKVLLGLLINYECRHMNGNESIKWHKYAVAEIMVALDVCVNLKNVSRYKFMIFNISVAFWKIVHPYLRPNRAKFFAAEIKRVTSALEEQNDADKDWRIMFLSAAAVCAEDEKSATSVTAATELVDKAIEHADALLQLTLTEEERLNAILKEASAEKDRIMVAFRAIEEQEILRNKPKKIDPDAPPDDPNVPPEPRILPPLTGLAAEGYDKVKVLLDVSQARKSVADTDLRVVVDRRNVQLEALLRLYLQRVSVNPADAKRFSTLPAVLKYPRASSLVTVQCMLVNAIPDKEWETTLAGVVKKLSDTPASLVRNETLADVARAAWRLKLRTIAIQCCDLALQGNIVSKILKVKTDVCAALKALSDLSQDNANQVTGSRLSIKQSEGFFTTKRIEGVKALESALLACGKIENTQFLTQEICVTMWNAMIPLLVPHLRQRVHSALKSMASALRTVSSPLAQLRMEVHAELAKCEDTSNAVENARDEALNALNCDYGVLDKDAAVNASNARDGPSTIATGGVGALSPNEQSLDRNRHLDHFILPYLNLLELRCLVYDSPGDVEGQALLWLHQAKESKLKPFILDNVTKSLVLMMDLLCLNTTSKEEEGGVEESKQDELSNINQTLKRNAAGVIDFNALVASKGPVAIPPVPIEQLEKTLLIARTGDKYTQFTPVLQLHHRIMYNIVTLAHVLENVPLLQQAAMYVLRPVWDPADPFVRELIDAQVHVQYLVADNLVVRIQSVSYKRPVLVKDPLLEGAVAEEELTPEQVAARSVDPRCLGFQSEEVSAEIQSLKRMVVQYLDKGLAQAVLVKDIYALQNGIIFFWNLHVHLFRNGLYKYVLEEIPRFLVSAIAAVDSVLASLSAAKATLPAVAMGAEPAPFDHRLRLSLLETLASYYESKGQLAEAFETANKGAILAGAAPAGKPAKGAPVVETAAPEVSEYLRKKICEQSSRLSLLLGASGAAGGKGAPKAGEPPVFGNVFLNVFAIIVQAEQPAQLMPKETATTMVSKAIEQLEKDVEADLQMVDFVSLSQERFSQLLEMQVEAWTRLTRLRMLFGDTIGSQYTAEKCLALVSVTNLSKADEAFLSPRVWRWVSVCERFFGLAVAAIIQPTGQDLALQCDLRFVALDHFALACDNALRANNEQLVVDAATNAWNICTPLIDLTDLRTRLYPVQRRIVDALNACKGADPVVRNAVDKLRQQFYLAMIEGFANVHDWDSALKVVLEAFNHVSKELQKPLWQWRVITLSKKGKNVLDGIQKLKETDPSLQAQVYGILARASSNPQQQLESYMKAIEILSVGLGKMERVDYMLELAQWMGSNGVPGADISTLVQSALDALYEVEEQSYPEDAFAAEDDEEETSERAESVAAISVATKRTTATRTGQRGAVSANGSVRGVKSGAATTRRGSRATSVAAPAGPKLGPDGKPIEEEKLPPRLDFKMLEQTSRALVMQSMLESTQAKRTDKYLEAVFFVRKSLTLWMNTLYFLYRKQAYAALRPEQRGEAPVAAAEPPAKGAKGAPVVEAAPEVVYATFESFEPPRPAFLCPPEEPVLLISWLAAPSQQLADLMVVANTQCADDVPSKDSLPALQLTLHYWQVLADGLRGCGHCKSALLVYSYCRMVLLYLTPTVTGTAAVLSAAHFQCVTLLMEMGLPTEALALPQSLPVGEFNTKLCPGEKPLANLTVGAYLVKYVVDTNAEGEKSLAKHEKVEAKPISAFGFSTWTPVFTYAGGFDVPAYMLQVCDALLALGQVQQCHNLVLTVEKQFTHRQDDRALVQTTSLLAKIALLNGRYEDSVSMILARREQMDRAGDAKELAMHTELLVQAYLKLDDAEEARQVALLALSLLEDVSLKMIDKNAIANAVKQQQSAVNNNTLSKAAVTNSRASLNGTMMRTSTSMKSVASNRASNLSVEASAVNITAYVRVMRSYIALTLQVTAQLIADHQDPRSLYVEMCEKLGRCVDLVSDVSGDVSLLVSEVLTLRATSAVELLVLLHQRASGVVTPGETYANWMRDNIFMCVEHMNRVVDFNQQLAQQVPATELTYTSEKIVADAHAASTDQITQVPYKAISNPVVRMVALSQLQLASVLVVQAVVSGDHVSRTVHDAFNAAKALSSLTAVDKYLEVTKPPPTFDLNDFQLPGLTKAAQLLSECSRRLAGPSVDPSGVLDVLPEVELLRSAALMLQHHRDGVFDCMWSQAYPLPAVVTHVANAEEKSLTSEPTNAATAIKAKVPATGKSATTTVEIVPEPAVAPILMSPVGDVALAVDAKNAREALVAETKKLLPKVSTQCASAGAALVPSVKSLRYSCLALVEAFGQHRPAAAAMWLLTLQSVQSSIWLRSVWREFSLNPTNDVAASLSRLEDLNARTWPKKGSIQQILAEQEFLTNSSVAYKRLSFAADPLEIVRALPASVAVFCLQFCPVHNTLYACVGVRSPVIPVVAEKPAKGAAAVAAPVASSEDAIKDAFWAIDKVELTESQRRGLQVLLQQHKSWVTESTKFIATYGESAPTDCDLEGTTSKYESKNLRKAERALEEKLRALVADMESLLAPLLGPASRLQALLQVLTVGTEGAAPVLKEGSSSLLMLIDPSLQQLPWEALQLAGAFNGRVSRDFSLHMTHHRLQTLTTPAAAPTTTTGAAAATAAATASAAGAAIINVTASAVRYVADPLREDEYTGSRMPGLQRKSITQAVQTLIQGNQSTTEEDKTMLPVPPVVVPSAQKWVPVRSQNGIASLQDFIVSVDAATPSYAKTAGGAPIAPTAGEKPDKAAAAAAAAATAAAAAAGAANSTLLVYTLGRIAGSLPPVDMASLDLQKLALFLCLDMGQNDTSNRRQMSADVLKTARQIASEQPLVVSALSSLSGVGALLVHAWSTPINAQNRFLALFMQKFAASAPVPAAPNAVVPPMELSARTLLASVAAAGYTSASPMCSATKSATASTSKHHRKSSMRSQLGSFSEDALDTGRSLAEESVDGSVLGSVAHSVAHSVAASVNAAPALYPIKKWIRLARVVYGVSYITYSEA